jgi:hypothetical protein
MEYQRIYEACILQTMPITIVLSYEIGTSCSQLRVVDMQSKVNYTVNKEAQKHTQAWAWRD